MLRNLPVLLLLAAAFCLNGFKRNDPFADSRPFPYNSLIASIFLDEQRGVPDLMDLAPESDSSALFGPRVLLLQYSAYDSVYAAKMRTLIYRQMPNCLVSEFWEGSAENLRTALTGQDIVVAAYPSNGQAGSIRAYGKELAQFASQGGGVVLTGTHEFSVLQQYGLLDIDYGYYCKDPNIQLELATTQTTQSGHPIVGGLPEVVNLQNYAYPLDVSDPLFVTLAEMRGYPVLGYKPLGLGKVVYLGIEFYHEENEAGRIMLNTLRWLSPVKANPSNEKVRQRKEEFLFAGSASKTSDKVDLLVYPNPYASKATLDIELSKPNTMSVNVTDELGRLVLVLLPRKNLQPGLYRFELPNLPAGVYFVQCRTGEIVTVKRVVKGEAR